MWTWGYCNYLCDLQTLQTFEKGKHKRNCIELILCCEQFNGGITFIPGCAGGLLEEHDIDVLVEIQQNEINLGP